MQYNYQSRYLVVINEITYGSVYKYEKQNIDQPFISFKPKHIFIGESNVCEMAKFSGAVIFDFNDITILPECENNEYVYSSGLQIFTLKTNNKIVNYISLMDNKNCCYANIIGENNTYSIEHHYKFTEIDKSQKALY